MNINCLLFDGFETLDLFGPVEVFGKIDEYDIKYYSMQGGIITSAQNSKIATEHIDRIHSSGILLVPGGHGTRALVNDIDFIGKLKDIAEKSIWCLSVCTGSALLAKTGLLDNRNATSNKIAFEWVKSVNKNVNWQYNARWVVDGKYYTSAGISAGMDMSLGFIADRFDKERACYIANIIEYKWNSDNNS
ncbi:MAG: DJ-1/PfpI family protein [Campylobacteraceae bacterium]|jgi:putative intracellular protease/amidase|nr:DJ-1/PfpI family protein [Campylobacteraceae bacterium]